MEIYQEVKRLTVFYLVVAIREANWSYTAILEVSHRAAWNLQPIQLCWARSRYLRASILGATSSFRDLSYKDIPWYPKAFEQCGA